MDPIILESSFGRAIYEEGFAEGFVIGKREVLLGYGTKFFGPPDVATKRAIESVDSRDRIDELFDRCFVAKSWDELLDDSCK